MNLNSFEAELCSPAGDIFQTVKRGFLANKLGQGKLRVLMVFISLDLKFASDRADASINPYGLQSTPVRLLSFGKDVLRAAGRKITASRRPLTVDTIKSRLSLMMFLQYAVWGVWLPVLATYLQSSVDDGGMGFTSGQVGLIIGVAGSVGAVSAPFIAGQFADRYFATEKFLAALLVFGGIVKIRLSYQDTFAAWLVLATLYSVLYMPTLS